MKNNKFSFVINLFVIFIVLLIVLYFSLKDDYKSILLSIHNMKVIYVFFAIIVLVIYRMLASFSHYLLVKQNNENISYLKMLQINFIILFFHGVTPFAGGGQPMEVYFLHKEGVPITKAANITLQNFIVYQISLVLMGVIALVYNVFFNLFPSNRLIKKLVILGFLINLLVLIITYVISFGKKLNKFILEKGIHFIAKIGIIKDEEAMQEKFRGYITRFHKNASVLREKRYLLIFYVFVDMLGLVFLYSMPFVVAHGLSVHLSLMESIVATAYVMIIGSFVPIPGGTGGIEYGFMFFYSYFIKGSILNAIMLVWRFVSYYLGMIFGAIALSFYRKEGERMRVGIFTDTYTPFINGVTTSVLMLKKALERRGHVVYIVTVNAETLKYQIEENGRVVRIPGIPIGIYDYRLTGIYPIKAIKMIKKWNLDVIHSQTEFGIGTFARIISKQLHIPLVHTYHTMYEDYVHYITHGYFNRSSKKIVEYLTLFYCDKTISELVVPTKKAYELFKEKYLVDRNVYIVPTGIDVEKFYRERNSKVNIVSKRKELGIDKDDFVILFVGRVASEKNIELLLSSMKSLVNISNKIKLLVVGDGPDFDKYQDYVVSSKLDKNVIFAGKVPWNKISVYYLISNCFATASKTETQGLTVIEAMAASLPVVAIDDESFTDTVINGLNGIIFRNKREYKRAIVKLFNDKDYLYKLSSQARISAETHSSNYFAEQILDVYKIAISRKPKHKIPFMEKVHNFLKRDDD